MGDFPEIESSRLILRALKFSDIFYLKEFYTDKDSVESLGLKVISDEELKKSFNNRILEMIDFQGLHYSIYSKEIGRVIGFISVWYKQYKWELGFGIVKKFRGNGFAKESVFYFLEFLKASGLTRVIAGVKSNNLPSLKILISIGFEKIGETTFFPFHEPSNKGPLLEIDLQIHF